MRRAIYRHRETSESVYVSDDSNPPQWALGAAWERFAPEAEQPQGAVEALAKTEAAYEQVAADLARETGERERLREALEWIYAEPEDAIKVQLWARAALDGTPFPELGR